ncbi:MAG: hypothetical protein R3185_01165 [Candidatus Thermoplasmatota archaeon]|nr:hypothetical protein [Candidatus Thermoplasmatota archaeon]
MISPQVERGMGIGLIVLGALLFLFFGIVRGGFGDVGVYAITVVPVVLGFGAIWRASGMQAS